MGFDELIDPREIRNVLLHSLERALYRRQEGAEPVARIGTHPERRPDRASGVGTVGPGEQRADGGEVDLGRRGTRDLVDDEDLRRQLVAGEVLGGVLDEALAR